jgi:hypothetical protein
MKPTDRKISKAHRFYPHTITQEQIAAEFYFHTI